MITYFTQGQWFMIKRDRFAPRSQSWIAYEDGDTSAFCYGATKDDLIVNITRNQDMHKRISERLERKGL